MFAGYEALEEYEDELYREAENSSESGPDSEVEFQLYSQVHYSMKLDEPGSGDREKERNQPSAATLLEKRNDIIVISDSEPILISDAAEVVIVSDETDLDSVCNIKGKQGPISKTAKRRLLDGQTLLESNSCTERTPSSKPLRLRDAITMSTGLNSFRESVAVEKSKKYQDGETSDSDDSDHVESWMILGRANQDGDNTILLNLDGSSASENEAGAADNTWTISEQDIEAQISNTARRIKLRSRYYTPDKNVTCRNCNKHGHLSKNCPTPKKAPVCSMCAVRGHMQRSCPDRYCTNCYMPGHCYNKCIERAYWHKQCHRCGMTGHYADACPEIWRQYHLTTRSGPLIMPDAKSEKKTRVYCHNCSRKGHHGYECSQRRMFNETFPTVPYICYYDAEKDIRERNHRIQRKVEALKEAGLLDHINFSHSVGKEAQPPKKIRKVKEERRKRGRSKPQKEKKNLPMKKTWPEKRKERRLKSKKKKSVQVIEEDFPRGPKMPSPRAHSHSKKKFARAALFSHMKNQGDEFNEKHKKPKVKGKRKKRDSSHDDSFAVDDSLFLIKQRNKNRKR
ncbi:zinc finger CCHC domain-containing protein 7 [Acipenser ruthenus]|uniref:zinc finger CCHC domain-containing protein 7 n=2 Tax=Acipenser ruthenus TaxID=7906 RepID=UPI00145A4DAA|nr:zinc finger CCHC domain-containing protein 7 [Acipenser ruthenus]